MPEQEIAMVKQLLERNIAALNAQDSDRVLANQQPDAELVISGGVTLRGHDQLRQYVEALWTAFPDGAFSFVGQVLSADAAAVELEFTGTQTGSLATPSGAIAPTGRRVVLRSASVMRFQGGLIASEPAYTNQLEFVAQLGLS
jgi:predicted ester cyclase